MPRGHKARAARQGQASLSEVLIPDKLYFRIGEVSDLVQTEAYVLRYWETEFPMLKPVKSRSGHRLYRRQDVQTVLEIKRLLYDEGFTIEGARKQLSGNSQKSPQQKDSVRSGMDGVHLRAIKRELQSMLTILSKKC